MIDGHCWVGCGAVRCRSRRCRLVRLSDGLDWIGLDWIGAAVATATARVVYMSGPGCALIRGCTSTSRLLPVLQPLPRLARQPPRRLRPDFRGAIPGISQLLIRPPRFIGADLFRPPAANIFRTASGISISLSAYVKYYIIAASTSTRLFSRTWAPARTRTRSRKRTEWNETERNGSRCIPLTFVARAHFSYLLHEYG